MRCLDGVDINDQRVGLRLDLNVPIKNGTILDNTRIIASIPTIEYLLERNCKILIISHLGRPKEDTFEQKYSLTPVCDDLSNILGTKIKLITTLDEAFQSNEKIFLLENIRFFIGEKDNSLELSDAVANTIDAYVFDAFGTAHRKHASTYGVIQKCSNSCAGLLVEKEVKNLTKALFNFRSPLISIIGGSKISTKLGVIQKLCDISDFIITGGGITNNLLLSKGFQIGKSIFEEEMEETSKKILANNNILLPDMVIASKSLSTQGSLKSIEDVESDEMILDIRISNEMSKALSQAKTILWNGPLGVFENENFELGTKFLCKSIAELDDCFVVAGGGETISAINKFISTKDISYCSTAGGAFLEFVEGKELPSLEALGFKREEEKND